MNNIHATTYILPLVNSYLNTIFNLAITVILMCGVICLANIAKAALRKNAKEIDAKSRTGKERVYFFLFCSIQYSANAKIKRQ